MDLLIKKRILITPNKSVDISPTFFFEYKFWFLLCLLCFTYLRQNSKSYTELLVVLLAGVCICSIFMFHRHLVKIK